MLDIIIALLVSWVSASALGNTAIVFVRAKFPRAAAFVQRFAPMVFAEAEKAHGIDLPGALLALDAAKLEAEKEQPDGATMRVHLARAEAMLGRPAKARALPLVLGVLGVALCGCGAPEKLVHAAQLSAVVIEAAEPCLMAQRKAQMEACLVEFSEASDQRACVQRVRAVWDPIVDALGELRDVRCEIEPAKCPEEAEEKRP